jgi:hypothetical protein
MIEFILEFIFWTAVFLFIRKHMDRKMEEKIIHQNELIKKVNDSTHIIKSEKHGDIEYWFDFHSDEFLAQGKTLNELIVHCKYRFPDHSFYLAEDKLIKYRISGPDWQVSPVKIPVLLVENTQ